MIKGTTPTHIFNIPFDTSQIAEVRVLYAQNNKLILTKTTTDVEMEYRKIKVTLTQEDTFLFDTTAVEIQVRVLTNEGVALSSVPQKVGVCKCLEDEVLV